MKKSREEAVAYINGLKGYEGYVQFSNGKIRPGDIFKGYQDIVLQPSEGFVYEAHFFNGKESIAMKQLNGYIYIDENRDIVMDDANINLYKSKAGTIKMVQIWEKELDPLCEDMYVKKCKKVLFAGFVDGGSK
jgi:CRISPR type III-associated protein (TIGR04423 family)